MSIKHQNGLTLVEIIIVASLFVIIIGSIFSVLATAKTSWKAGNSQMDTLQEARRGMNIMAKELRQARRMTITGVPADGNVYNSITFQIPESISYTGTSWSSNIQYYIGGLNNAQLIRAQDGSQRVMANNVTALNLSRETITPDVLNISVTCRKQTFSGFDSIQSSATLLSEVTLRND